MIMTIVLKKNPRFFSHKIGEKSDHNIVPWIKWKLGKQIIVLF
jgi:hypothetical protein